MKLSKDFIELLNEIHVLAIFANESQKRFQTYFVSEPFQDQINKLEKRLKQLGKILEKENK